MADRDTTPCVQGTSNGARKRNDLEYPVRKTVTIVSLVLNVIVLAALAPAVHVLWLRINLEPASCSATGNGVTPGNDVMSDDVSRYCFSGSEEECRERGFKVKVGEGEQPVCCADLGDHVYGVMAEEIPQRLRSDAIKDRALRRVRNAMKRLHADDEALRVRPAAHVGIDPSYDYSDSESDYEVHWRQSGEETFLAGAVEHLGDRLRIVKGGYYYVYTGLQFSVDIDHPDTSEAIVSFLFRSVNGTRDSRRKLMESRESSCRRTRSRESGAAPVSMYMAGIFPLYPGDEVSVLTTSRRQLTLLPTATYLGLHMV